MTYGQLPKDLGVHRVDCPEMMFYQYLPIKMIGETQPVYEPRLKCFDSLVGAICCDFIGVFGLDTYVGSYVYLTAKFMYQPPLNSFNRMGWHSDGFMTDDINYVWCDVNPTLFANGDFDLTMDDEVSLKQMERQVRFSDLVRYPENTLLRLDQFNIHRVADCEEGKMRAFLKISFSKDKYDLIGNSHNYQMQYDWPMKQRKSERNIPQSKAGELLIK